MLVDFFQILVSYFRMIVFPVIYKLTWIFIILYIAYLADFSLMTYNRNLVYKPLTQKLRMMEDSGISKYGSCGWVAYLTAEYLEKKNIKYTIYAIYKDTIPNFHIYIVSNDFAGFSIDGFGFHPLSYNYLSVYESHEISKERLSGLIRRPIWNKRFNMNDTTILKQIFNQ